MGMVVEDFIGRKATFRVKHENDLLSGEIQNVDVDHKTIIFYKVTVHEPGKPPKVLGGLQQYHIDELVDLDVLDNVNLALKEASLGEPYERHDTKSKKKSLRLDKEGPHHLQNLTEFDATLIYMLNIVEKEMERTKDENGQYESNLPPDCTLLDNCNSELFRSAMNHLKKCSTVGVAFEGVNLGRNGQLSWILVSTGHHTMFFDVKTMGKEGFSAGIRDFLQSSKVMKVIHDCRRPSDILYHQYDTKLVNVFDTQVGAVHCFKVRKNSLPRYVTNLAECLRSELQLSEEDIHVPFLRGHDPQKDEEVWTLRPAPSIVYQWMHKHSQHLLALRDRQMELMMKEYSMGVDLYLKSLRDLFNSEAETRMTMQHMLPTEYTDLTLLVKAWLREDETTRNGRCAKPGKARNGLVDNWTGYTHPKVIGSRDTIWHMRPSPREMEQEKTSQGRGKRNDTVNHVPETRSGEDLVKDTPQDPLSSRQPVRRSGQLDSSMSGTPKGSDRKMSSSTASDSAEENKPRTSTATLTSDSDTTERKVSVQVNGASKAESNLSQRDKVAALLSQVAKEHKEKEETAITTHTLNYVFRPAGELVQVKSKRKQKKLESSKTMPTDDLASKSVKTCSVPNTQIDENEFDTIPFQSKLSEMNRSRQPTYSSGFVVAPSEESLPQDKDGFDITTFKEGVPPPPYYVSKQTGKSDVQNALAAILPRVDDQSLLLDGSRACPSARHLQQKNCENTNGVASSGSNAEPVACENKNNTAQSRLLTRNELVSLHNCALNSDAVVPAENLSHLSVRAPQNASETVQKGNVSAKNGFHSQDNSLSSTSVTVPKGTSSSSFSSASSSQVVPFSAKQASPISEVGTTNSVSCTSTPNTETGSSQSSRTSSPSAGNACAQSSRAGANGLSTAEIKRALANGESVLSILGFKKSPQQIMSSKLKSIEDQRHK